jgi:glucose/arabinose dehydrogenase
VHVTTRPLLLLLALAACTSGDRPADTGATRTAGSASDTAAASAACPDTTTGITLPPGFCATVFADSLGHARHVAVAANGDVYVNTWSGQYYSTDEGRGRRDGYVVALRDTTRDGKADLVQAFGGGPSGNTGGTGIALHGGYVYAEAGPRIVRYRLTAGQLAPNADVKDGEVIVAGFPTTGSHPQHNFAIAPDGALYANMGSATNSCQQRDRTTGSAGVDPCTELATRAGIWKFDANRTGQRFGADARWATGVRNAVGLTVGPDGAVWATQHGRDQLAENWPEKFTPAQGQETPSEELLRVAQGADYGWPYCYFDGTQRKRVLAPEYGGDGKEVGRCASAAMPVATFPAHWAPNAVVLYTGTQFPQRYRNGAFVAFHGSWNRAPGTQGGYNVVFVPLDGAQAAGEFEPFAQGFAGSQSPQPTSATYRPSGLAVGPDGALYITEDVKGRVWRVTYGRR